MQERSKPRFPGRVLSSIAIVICLAATGCNRLHPQWGPQNTIGMQRNRAAMHDPFPSNELGPPLAGVRPLGFEQPKAIADSLQTSPYARRGMRGGQYVPQYGF